MPNPSPPPTPGELQAALACLGILLGASSAWFVFVLTTPPRSDDGHVEATRRARHEDSLGYLLALGVLSALLSSAAKKDGGAKEGGGRGG